MTLETKLAELADRRDRFKDFRDSVDEDLARQRVERLAAENAAIDQLIVESAAEGATLGQIKRAYGTKDHRTISEKVKAHAPEIAALRAGRIAGIKDQPTWFTLTNDGRVIVQWEDSEAEFTYSTMEDGQFLFNTDESRWDPTFTTENKAVALLDGKTETDSNEARVLAKFIRKQASS
jgi:hypothetical protein